MTIVKAAAVQLSPVLYSREGTVEKVARTIRELGRMTKARSASCSTILASQRSAHSTIEDVRRPVSFSSASTPRTWSSRSTRRVALLKPRSI